MNDDEPATTTRRPGRPATGVTPKRQIRVGDVWDRVEALAAQTGEAMPAVVKRLLIAEERRLLREVDRRAATSAPRTDP